MRRRVTIGLAAGGVLASVVSASNVPVFAATSPTITGTLTAIPVTGTYQINQLFAGSGGQMWFVTPASQLGEISASGQTTLTSITLPHGQVAARIAAAGPEGVWSYSETNENPPNGNGCFIGLVTPDSVLHDMTLPAGPVRNQSVCSGAAADAAGNLWVSLASRSCGVEPCKVAVIVEMTPSGALTTFAPYRPGARPGAIALGSDGTMLILEGARQQALVDYSSVGELNSVPIYARPGATGLIGLPAGRFWVQVKSGFVLFNSVISTYEGYKLLPVRTNPAAIASTLPRQAAADAGGSLWEAGEVGPPGTGTNRFFRLDTTFAMQRTRSFPLAADGSQLLANGVLAISSTGDIWAAAVTNTGEPYLIRFQPLP
jgi:hypothetical protein